MSRRNFFSTCVRWPETLMNAKEWLDDHGEKIDRVEFLKLVDPGQMRKLERGLGYNRNLSMADDYHVGYFLDKYSGIPFFVHSATEHVFASREEIEALERHALDEAYREEAGILVIDRIGQMAGLPPLDPEFDVNIFPALKDEDFPSGDSGSIPLSLESS